MAWPVKLGWRLSCPDGVPYEELSRLNFYRKTGMLSDAAFKIQTGSTFFVHRVLLAAASEYLESLFSSSDSSYRVITLSSADINDGNLAACLSWIYNGLVLVPDLPCLLELLAAALFLRVDGLVEECKTTLLSKLCAENIFTVWFFADKIKLLELKDACCKYVAVNFTSLNHRLLMELPLDYVRSILRHDQLGVANEEDVWRAITAWIEYKADRQGFVGDLLSVLRMGLLNESFMLQVKNHTLVMTATSPMPRLREADLYFEDSSLHKFLNSFLGKASDIARSRIPSKLVLVLETGLTRKGFSLKWYDSRSDIWKTVCETKESKLKGSFVYPVMCCSQKNQIIFVMQDMNSISLVTKVFAMNLVTFDLKEMSTLNDFSGNQKLVCVDETIKMVKYFPSKAVQVYDATRNIWISEEVVNDDAPPKIGCCLASCSNNLYLIGGKIFEVGDEFCKTIAVYGCGAFHPVAELLVGRAGATCCEWNNKIIIAGGYSSLDGTDLSSVEVYDPNTNEVRELPPMMRARTDFYMMACDEGILVIDDWITRRENVEYYNPTARSWEKRASLDLRTHFVIGVTSVATENVLEAQDRYELHEEHQPKGGLRARHLL